ncbi:MAG: hypothetical protein JSW28_07890, partial [Thermoplasmata archaeon]
KTTYVYGDNGIYAVTLRVTDDTGLNGTDICNITVSNVAPTISLISSPSGNEGLPIIFTSSASDLGSDDLTVTWDWGDGTAPTTTNFYNDGTAPEPPYDPNTNEIKSPWGISPFNVTDTQQHTYGDNGIYTVSLRVEDDDNGVAFMNTTVTVNNIAPNITLVITPTGEEGFPFTFKAEANDLGSDDLTFTWEFEYGPKIENPYYNDGLGPEPIYNPVTNEVKSPWGICPFNASDTVTHTYGDDYNYTVILRVADDDGGEAVYTTTFSVDNLAPIITELMIPYPAEEGKDSVLRATARDFGSDDLTFEWGFGDMTANVTNMYFNNGSVKDLYPSPDGIYPFIAQDTLSHNYGDNYNYTLSLKVTDDDDGVSTFTTTVIVKNLNPEIEPFGPFTVDEGSPLDITAISTDLGSDDLTFTWKFELGPMIATTYFNDGNGTDPYPSPWGTNPFPATDTASCIYGDDGVFRVTLTVEDDDGGSTTYITNITVDNVVPATTIVSLTMNTEIGLRVAGRKYNNVSMTLSEEGNSIGYVSIERLPGSPNDQMAWIPMTLDMTNNYSITVTFIPKDPPNVGANPVWIYIKSESGSIEEIHHTFNVQQSKKRNSDHWNHVEPWEVDLSAHLVGSTFELTSHVTDLGSDDETLTYTYGTQIVTAIYLNDPPNTDPYPSPEFNPIDITDTTTLTYEGPGTVTLIVKDDDNIRLGVGQGSDSFNVT